jgi:secreted trypsin-like serine protease
VSISLPADSYFLTMTLSHDRLPFSHARRATRLGSAAALACLIGLSLPAQAIVSTTSPSNWVATSDSFDGVAKLTISSSAGTAVCSGSLLAGGAYVLTAAHCVTGSTGALNVSKVALSFDSGRVTASVSSAAQVTVYSGWNATLGQNNDLALLKLDTAVTSIAGYEVLTSSAIGSTVVLAGYGYSGIGTTGYSTSSGLSTLHWGENQYDSVYAGTSTSTGGSILYDFDNGTTQRNIIGGLGLGTYEAMIASGDSGGPSFVQTASGSLLLVGVHSFGARLNGTRYDIDSSLDGSYGELGGDTTLASASTLSWLGAVAQVSAVPEPASAALMAAGAALLLTARRRKA